MFYRTPSSGEELKVQHQAYNPLDDDVRIHKCTPEQEELDFQMLKSDGKPGGQMNILDSHRENKVISPENYEFLTPEQKSREPEGIFPNAEYNTPQEEEKETVQKSENDPNAASSKENLPYDLQVPIIEDNARKSTEDLGKQSPYKDAFQQYELERDEQADPAESEQDKNQRELMVEDPIAEGEDEYIGFGGGVVEINQFQQNPRQEEIKQRNDTNEDVESHTSFGRNDPIKNITVTNNDTDIKDFKTALEIKFEQFKLETIEKYQKIRLEYLQQMDYAIKENERQNASAVDYMEQLVDDATNERDEAVKRAIESKIIFANTMRTRIHTKRAVFNAWKYYFEWKKYKVAKSKF